MAEKIKVMTFNLRVAVKGDGVNYFDYRLPRILEFLNTEKPDVVGFQEVNDHMKEALNEHLTDYVIVGCGRESSYRGESACLAYRKDRFQLITLENFWLSATPSIPGSRYGIDQSSCPRVTTAALLKLREASAPFWFVNTHLDHEGGTARLLGSVQLLQYISELNVPCILTGDFNATPDTREIQVITENEICGLKDLTAGLGGTFHGFGKNDPENMPKIDYIFTNMKADPNEAFAIEDKGIDGVYISDHYPVCAFVDAE
jgi:endonuclease/exonuclease/phosphatase family metal-dependent hydrolase